MKSKATNIVNAAASYDIGKVTRGLEMPNLFDAKDADITDFFE